MISARYHEFFAGAGSKEGVIAGVLGVALLFYVERLAWTRRIVFLGRHVTPQQHTVGGPEVMVDAFRAGARLTDWRRALAHVLLSTPAGAAPLRPLSAVRDAAISGDSALYSWALARA